jgi:hypothetical protein
MFIFWLYILNKYLRHKKYLIIFQTYIRLCINHLNFRIYLYILKLLLEIDFNSEQTSFLVSEPRLTNKNSLTKMLEFRSYKA